MPTPTEAIDALWAGFRGPDVCLWPSEFAANDADTAWAFVKNCWTWNEAESAEQPMPDRAYLEAYCREWHACFLSGRTLITEKCRRMVVSWAARALELHQMGLARCDQVLVGEDLEAAAKHVWRLRFLYDGLRKRHPHWELPPASELKYEGERKLKSFWLANGSTCGYANGQSTGLQGEGVRIITLEELGIYRYPASILAQAKIVTQGSADSVGGFVNVITNASVNPEWQRIKRPS
ncbi:hypothetical protein EON79_02390 [bacterium]|nr:MAG: hypothetical protein EON79_02390 [bacterium]